MLHAMHSHKASSTIYEVTGNEKFVNGVPIGRAVSNSSAFVMDRNQQIVPVGVMRELVVAGDGLARGYTDAALDVDRFVPITIDGKRMRAYRTGERVRYRPHDGQIEFFGHMDQQIKIRGHRIEPAEVERAMLSHDAVHDAVVVTREQSDGQLELVGCIQEKPKAKQDPVHGGVTSKPDTMKERFAANIERDILKTLLAALPPHMIPVQVLLLDAIPVNTNGKVDRRELARRVCSVPKSLPASPTSPAFIREAPRNDLEALLCREFANVLSVEVGVTDNFFDLGGHSLTAAKLAMRLSRCLKTRVSVKDLFDHPVPLDLANKLQSEQSSDQGVNQTS